MIIHNLKDYVLCSLCRRFRYDLGHYQCKRGHLICRHCQPFTDVCPRCFIFVDVNDPILCNSAVDFLMDKVPVPCIYNGCTEKMERGKIREHVFICPFRRQVNVAVRNEGTGNAEAGTAVGGNGGPRSEIYAEAVLTEDMNDHNKETVGVGSGDVRNEHNYAEIVSSDETNDASTGGSEDGAETVIVEDLNDQNEEILADGAEGDVREDFTGLAVDINEETVGGGSEDIRNEDNQVEVIVLDECERQNEEHAGGAVDLGNEDETEETADMDNESGGKYRGAECAAAGNTNDNMEAEYEQNQEGDGAKVGDDRVVLAAEEEVDLGMEVEENNNGDGMEVDDIQMEEENLGSSSLRKGTRKRIQTQRYSSQTRNDKGTPAAVKSKSKKTRKPVSALTRFRKNYDQRQSKVGGESVFVDPTSSQSSSTTEEEETLECKICGIQFCRKDSLLRHNERKHQLQRPFECFICDQKFRQEVHVTNHLASFHSAPLLLKINEAEVAVYRCCMFCDRHYIKKDDLRNHISDMHKDQFETGGGN